MSFLKFSIDMDAELAKITQKQYLNAVHYLVNLVRHALTRSPSRIHVELGKDRVCISQDGDNLDQEEIALLETLAGEKLKTKTDMERQWALAQLENRFGITLLSLILNQTLELHTGNLLLSAQNGHLQVFAAQTFTPGYQLILHGTRKHRSGEEKELLFFCEGITTPLFINGTPVRGEIHLPDQMLTLRIETESGNGMLGIPLEGDACCLNFYKCGVRLATRQFLPENGYIYHGWWNSKDPRFEADYSETITEGERQLKANAPILYASLLRHFSAMNELQRVRIKKLLLTQSKAHWTKHYMEIPLFHSSSGNWTLSMKDLSRLEQRFHGIPYHPTQTRRAFPYLPLLNNEELGFITSELEKKVVLAKDRACISGSLKNPSRTPPPESILNADQIPRFFREVIDTLNQLDPICKFHIIDGSAQTRVDRLGHRHFYLPMDHIWFKKMKINTPEKPEDWQLLKYQIMGGFH